tara:strand:- start:1409 stop:1753 length:345 start_codon:yes stop_codon:yes gene_type:complete
MKTWEEKLTFYDEIIATNDKFKRLGKTMPYTAANTHMFSLFNKAGEIGMRLSKEDGESFMKDHDTTNYKSYGAVMKNYVLIPEHIYSNMDLLAATLEKSYQYAMSLKANPRKKK